MRLIFALFFVLLVAVVYTHPLSEEMMDGEMDERNLLFNNLVEEISEDDDDEIEEDDDNDYDDNDVDDDSKKVLSIYLLFFFSLKREKSGVHAFLKPAKKFPTRNISLHIQIHY